jgi:hypothetical protein
MAVGIHKVFLDPHFRVVADQAFDHRGDFRGREVAELRIETDRIGLDMPVD